MNIGLESLLDSFNLSWVEPHVGIGVAHGLGQKRVYGGHVLAQTISAAYHTVEPGLEVISLSSQFLRPAISDTPIGYHVTNLRDGKSISVRSVTAIQNGKVIFAAALTFQAFSDGFRHAMDRPECPSPDQLIREPVQDIKTDGSWSESTKGFITGYRPVEIRPVDHYDLQNPKPTEPRQRLWMRAGSSIPDSHKINACMLAYASDWSLLPVACQPHGLSPATPGIQLATIDHSMWFHQRVDFTDWHLYAIESPVSSNNRGLSVGHFFNSDGQLVVSAVQQGLIRTPGIESKTI